MGYVQRFLRDLQETESAMFWCRKSGIAKTTFSSVSNGTREPSRLFAEKLLKVLDEEQTDMFLRAFVRDSLPEGYHSRVSFPKSVVKEGPPTRLPSTKLGRATAYLLKRCEQDHLLAEHLVSLTELIKYDDERDSPR